MALSSHNSPFADFREIARMLAALFQVGYVVVVRVLKTGREGTVMLAALDRHLGGT